MKLSISNIAWDKQYDDIIYQMMNKYGYTGLEIAPTRILDMPVYDKCNEIADFSKMIYSQYGLAISSMQSIWYQKNENIFESKQSLQILLDYSKKAIEFAATCKCKNIVFGCPKNRNKADNSSVSIDDIYDFFDELGSFAKSNNTVFSIEPNPTIYNTNFINTTYEALDIVKTINNHGLKVNFDLGTVIQNEENIETLLVDIDYINHIHISEPYLKLIQARDIHKTLFKYLRDLNYNKYISIEMSKQDNINDVESTLIYVASLLSE